MQAAITQTPSKVMSWKGDKVGSFYLSRADAAGAEPTNSGWAVCSIFQLPLVSLATGAPPPAVSSLGMKMLLGICFTD